MKTNKKAAPMKLEWMKPSIAEEKKIKPKNWFMYFNSTAPKGWRLNEENLRKTMVEDGFRRYYVNKAQRKKDDEVLVRVVSNIIYTVNKNEVFDFYSRKVRRIEAEDMVKNAFKIQGGTAIKRRSDIIDELPLLKDNFLKDVDKIAYISFKNIVVKLSKGKEIEFIKHKDLGGLVWEESLIDFNFKKKFKSKKKADFEQFLENITGKSPLHLQSLKSIIGFLMHSYKDSIKIPIIILNDFAPDNKTAQGGSGKSLVLKSISIMKNTSVISRYTVDNKDNKFGLANITHKTKFAYVDDAEKNYNLNGLFDVVTGSFRVEVKNKSVFEIPFESSPKLAIATNYPITDEGSWSKERRRLDFSLDSPYGKNYSTMRDFKNRFFEGWSLLEWQLFYLLMIECLQEFLNRGITQLRSGEFEKSKIEAETDPNFVELLESEFNTFGKFYFNYEFENRLIEKYGVSEENKKYEDIFRRRQTLKNWLEFYGKNIGCEFSFEMDKKVRKIGFRKITE